MPGERSKPRFTTDGPNDGTGRDWHQYFTKLRKGSYVEVADPDADSSDSVPESITITIPAVEVPQVWFDAGAPQALRTWRNRLLANDWQFKCGASQAWHEDSYYKNGKLNQAAHFEEQWWINSVKDGQYLTISYNVSGGSVVSARTVRRLSGKLLQLSDAETKAIVENESA